MPPTNQPQPPVDQPAARPISPYGPPSQHYPPAAIDPGKNMGIVGMVLAFVFPFVGIVLSIISRSKSVKAGYSGGLGLAGIVINSVAILLWSLFLVIAIVAYQGVQERANEAAARTQIEILKQRSEKNEMNSTPNETSVPDPLTGTVADQKLQNDILRDLMTIHVSITGENKVSIHSIDSSSVADGHYIEKWTLESNGNLKTYTIELKVVADGVDYTILT